MNTFLAVVTIHQNGHVQHAGNSYALAKKCDAMQDKCPDKNLPRHLLPCTTAS